jgi:cytidine deaminase
MNLLCGYDYALLMMEAFVGFTVTENRMILNTVVDRRAVLASLASSSLGLLAVHSEFGFGQSGEGSRMGQSMPGLTDRSRQILQGLVGAREFRGQIAASRVQELVHLERTDVDRLMIGLLPLARAFSRPPISNYRVGAVVRGVSGNLYLGMNLEIPGHSLGFSVHGEQAALSNAYMHAEPGVAAIAVTAAPCGHCRQFMNEMSVTGEFEILVENKPLSKLSSLLPMAFGPRDLGFKEGGFPVRKIGLELPQVSDDKLAQAALDAAAHSYAPYSESPCGLAIGTKLGGVYKGSYIENAAFNPSLSPLQTALVQLIMAGEDYSAITRVVLVEIEDAKISQASVTRAVLRTIAGIDLQRFAAVRT